jgi:hypothetical protein
MTIYLEWRSIIYYGYFPMWETPSQRMTINWSMGNNVLGYSLKWETPASQRMTTHLACKEILDFGHSPVCETPASQVFFLPGVEGEDIFWILPGVRDTYEPGFFFTWTGGRGYIPDTPRCARHLRARVILPGVEGEDIFQILPGVRDTGEPGFFFTWSGGRGYILDTPRWARHRGAGVISPGVEGEDIFRILPDVRDIGEPGLFHLEWRARMYSGYSPVCETPGSWGYFTWSGGRGYILDTPWCWRRRRARVTSPGVEGEDIIRILPGVGAAGEPGLLHLEWRARIYSGYSPVLETPVCQWLKAKQTTR